ncbi:MAG TPA: 30S ribosomal protein S21 [bacterium]|nr:30S ribosomal protein S21 [bacterium]HSA34106.1 30S ribosomal protein S21 [bacterium]
MKKAKSIGPLEVSVTDDLERAIKILKKKMALEGLFKELKKRRHYEPPSIRDRRKREEAERRRRKNLRKKRV